MIAFTYKKYCNCPHTQITILLPMPFIGTSHNSVCINFKIKDWQYICRICSFELKHWRYPILACWMPLVGRSLIFLAPAVLLRKGANGTFLGSWWCIEDCVGDIKDTACHHGTKKGERYHVEEKYCTYYVYLVVLL